QALALPSTPVTSSVTKSTGNTLLPMWSEAALFTPDIMSSSTEVFPSIYIRAYNPSSTITGRMYLEKKVGNSWEEETSWALSGTGSVFKERNYPGEPGNTYRTRVVAFVNSERVEDTSSECTI
ncbi:MAG: hypothetical protein IJD18_03690, partial [Clostridia bacterium]|nr:hypothetical protein [Clostridia bacterium]